MGLMHAAKRQWYVWSWRCRYWWMDTRGGEYAQWALVCVGVFVVIVQTIKMCVAAAMPVPPVQTVQAAYWWVVQLVIAIVAAAVSLAMRPKVQPPQPQESKAPVTEDGQAVRDHFGTCWVEDEFLLAWKKVRDIPIKTKSGKK